MKRILSVVSLVFVILAFSVSLTISQELKDTTSKTGQNQPDWEVPLAAGVWYPQNGALPEKPMRYYRVRCWPGCHTGSSLGKYSQKPLRMDTPIFHTSTIDNIAANHESNE